ncbi:DUF4234 domain-containing protein [Morganella sp. GD04133]|uniref:DUF4234 domain-containing protein n=1 Tax=Morganella sp. GD04133 TaxID=2975435 RepID=UPI002446AA57|nr:DUF4234 domain-containing protein [Morganella sp. GD04133]MDH0353370.1 DUF4234 domain-containing protein [Morganella sp. GD04133]
MKDINTLKSITNQGTGRFVLLSMLTAGIYPVMWAWKNADAFNSELKEKTFESKIFIYLAIVMGLSLHMDVLSMMNNVYHDRYTAGPDDIYTILSNVFSISVTVFWVVWSFKMKRALENYAEREFGITLYLNRTLTFLFQYFYINYCMNALEEDFSRGKMLTDVRNNQINHSTDNDDDKI